MMMIDEGAWFDDTTCIKAVLRRSGYTYRLAEIMAECAISRFDPSILVDNSNTALEYSDEHWLSLASDLNDLPATPSLPLLETLHVTSLVNASVTYSFEGGCNELNDYHLLI